MHGGAGMKRQWFLTTSSILPVKVHSPSQGQHGPQLHHFRSSSLSKEKAYIQQCWEKCVRENITIPAYIIRVDQEDGSTKVMHTTHLEDKNGHIQDCEGRVIPIANNDIVVETEDEPEKTVRKIADEPEEIAVEPESMADERDQLQEMNQRKQHMN